jgi:hypothetical protein
MPPPTLLVKGSLSGEIGEKNKHKIPIDYIIDRIKSKMYEYNHIKPTNVNDRIFIIRSETGSGKSTVLPAYVFRLLRGQRSSSKTLLSTAGVICTQPKVLTAQALAWDQAHDTNYPDLQLGTTVGYQSGPFNDKPTSGLIYSTAGILLMQFHKWADDEIMEKYKFIIIDEAHERSLEIDCLLMYLKKFMLRNITNPRVPFVLLASATLPVEKYKAYFGIDNDNIIGVTGRAYPIKDIYMKNSTLDYYKSIVETVKNIHEQNQTDQESEADILVFLPGKSEIDKIYIELTKLNFKYITPESNIRPFKLLQIDRTAINEQSLDYRMLKTEDLKVLRIMSTDGKTLIDPIRRITLSTVVAETGLTIETLKYVVDCGWDRTSETYFPGNYSGLLTRPAPRSKIKQRKGRAGRKFPGIFYPMYTEETYNMLNEEQLPDIIKKGIESVFLSVCYSVSTLRNGVKQFKLSDFDLLDNPPTESLEDCMKKSLKFGYITVSGILSDSSDQESIAKVDHMYTFTKTGDIARQLGRFDLQQSQTLLSGYLHNVCILDLIFITLLYDTSFTAPFRFYEREPMTAVTDPNYKFRELALRACIPDFLASVDYYSVNIDGTIKVGSAESPDKLPAYTPLQHSDEPFYRTKILISDDFIEALMIFDKFMNISVDYSGNIAKLSDWCTAHGISLDGALELADARDKVIDDVIAAGLNPFYNTKYKLSDATVDTFMDRIINIKKCIYAGLQYNLIKKSDGIYKTKPSKTLEYNIDIPSQFSPMQLSKLRDYGIDEFIPNNVVTNKIIIAKAPKSKADKNPPLLYKLIPNLISIMDGYVL